MKISLITINRNNAKGLQRTLLSVAQQLPYIGQENKLEHIIVDGLSTDDSLSVLLPQLDSKIISLEPKGVYNALNAGIEVSTGEIIGMLHSGDTFAHSGVLAQVIKCFESKEIAPDYIWADVRIGRRYFSGEGFTPKSITAGFAPPHPSLYISRKTFQSIGLYDESFKIGGDIDYFIRLSQKPELKGYYCPEKFIEMEGGGLSQRFVSRVWVNNRERLRALRKNGISSNPFRLLCHYKQVAKGYLCSSKK